MDPRQLLCLLPAVWAVCTANVPCLSPAGEAGESSDAWGSAVSPNGRLRITVSQKALDTLYPGQRRLYYRVELDGREVLPDSPLGVRRS